MKHYDLLIYFDLIYCCNVDCDVNCQWNCSFLRRFHHFQHFVIDQTSRVFAISEITVIEFFMRHQIIQCHIWQFSDQFFHVLRHNLTVTLRIIESNWCSGIFQIVNWWLVLAIVIYVLRFSVIKLLKFAGNHLKAVDNLMRPELIRKMAEYNRNHRLKSEEIILWKNQLFLSFFDKFLSKSVFSSIIHNLKLRKFGTINVLWDENIKLVNILSKWTYSFDLLVVP